MCIISDKAKEKRRKYSLDYYYRHKERCLANNKCWRVQNKDVVREFRKQKRIKDYACWQEELEKIGMTKCIRCGYDKCFSVIDFHHPDPTAKEYGNCKGKLVGNVVFRESYLQRLDGLVPLCKNCHMELHMGLWTL